MGIWLSRQSMIDTLLEVAAFKAGVVLTEADVVELTADTSIGQRFLATGKQGGRIGSEEMDEAVAQLLYGLGNIASPSTLPITIQLYHRFRCDPEKLEIFLGVQRIYNDALRKLLADAVAAGAPHGTRLDPEAIMRPVAEKFGRAGLDIVMEIISGTNNDLHRSAWGSVRNLDWKDEVELKALFESEKLDASHGRFLDQRFIDFLDRNFDKIDEMHWRKFEGLAGEFFEREGYRVEMGPGRGDEGVDLRIFPKDAVEGDAPLIIVQCKRQRAKIDMVLVKSVYTDVEWEKAASGLIVTTSTFSPGAERIRTARAYPVEAVDRPKLREWLAMMRSRK